MAPDCAESSTKAATNRVHPDKRHFSEYRFPSTWRGIKMMNPSKGGPVLLLHFHSQWHRHAGRCHGIVLENFSSRMGASRAMPPAVNRLAALAQTKSLTSDLGSPRSISAVVRLVAFCFFSLAMCWECSWVTSSIQCEYPEYQKKDDRVRQLTLAEPPALKLSKKLPNLTAL